MFLRCRLNQYLVFKLLLRLDISAQFSVQETRFTLKTNSERNVQQYIAQNLTENQFCQLLQIHW